MRILDLCSGTGSATAPFAAAGWEVVTVDNDPRCRPSILADVCELAADQLGAFDVVWASPPCRDFSRSDQVGLYPAEPPPDLTVALACCRLINAINPAVWWLENVRGARRHFYPFLGKPACHLGSWWLWTNAIFLPALAERPTKVRSGYRKGSYPRKRMAVHPAVAGAVYGATVAHFV